VVARYRFAMRALLIILVSLGLVAAAHAADAVTGKIVKVLPFFLDQQGHDATSPSLFDRDAYQAYLREHTNEVSALRFDVLWTAAKAPDEELKIVAELRGIGASGVPKLKTIEVPVGVAAYRPQKVTVKPPRANPIETTAVPGNYRKWTEIPLAGDDYKNFGTVVAWRVTLWNGGRMLGEQKSFLW